MIEAAEIAGFWTGQVVPVGADGLARKAARALKARTMMTLIEAMSRHPCVQIVGPSGCERSSPVRSPKSA
jgi:hypothetical protein